MVAFLGIIQFISIAGCCMYELKIKSSAVFLWAVLLIMFGIPHMLSAIMGTYSYTTSTMREASIFVILFTIIYLLVRYIFRNKKSTQGKEDKLQLLENEQKGMTNFMYVLFAIMVVIVFIRIVSLSKQAGGLFNTSWETMRQTGGYFSFAQIFTPIFFASSSCILLAIKIKDKKFIIFSIIIILIEVLISRNRIEILPIFVAIIYAYILKENKIGLKKIFILGCIGIISIYCIYALRVFRHSGSAKNFIDMYNLKTFNLKVFDYLENDDGELGLRKYMYYFIENDNNFQNFGKGHTYLRMLFVLIPTKWSFGLKPDDFAITMGKAILPNSTGFSMHPTLFGDVYANFGFYGFLWGAFWAIFVNMIDRIIEKRNKIIYLPLTFIFCISYIIEARGSVYNGFVWSVYGYVILIFIYIVFKVVKNSVSKNN